MRNTLTSGYHISILLEIIADISPSKRRRMIYLFKNILRYKAFTNFCLNGFILEERYKNVTKENNIKCVNLCN